MKLKYGVSLDNLKIQMRYVMKTVNTLWKEFDQEAVITAGTEATNYDVAIIQSTMELVHSPSSLHPFGYALDFRTRYFSTVDKARIATKLQARLNLVSTQYKVILEKDHIHVEWRGFAGCF